MPTVLYWIRRQSHTDIATEGYVGVSNWFRGRKFIHKRSLKHGSHKNPLLQNAFNKYKNEIVIDVVTKGSLSDCLQLEANLRPHREIGWNLLPGGGLPPSRRGSAWFTNGVTNVSRLECPDGFWPGKVQKSGPTDARSQQNTEKR